MKRLIASLVLLTAAGLVLALASGSDRATGDGKTAGPPVPDVSVRGSTATACSRSPRSRPTTPRLLWFWAPWCEVCNHEAPAIEKLAEDADGEIAVVTIGGRDNATNGPAFVARHHLRTPTILFDEPMGRVAGVRHPRPAGRRPTRPLRPRAPPLARSVRPRRRAHGRPRTLDGAPLCR